ncbi:MAG TPA: arylesterase [Gemmatirosa sp.]
MALQIAGAACSRPPAADTPERASPPEAAAASAPASAPADAPARGRPRVVFIGTSLTAGLGLDPDSAYPAVVGRRAASAGTPIEVVNAGVSGETSAGALRRIDWVLHEPADVVVIETGANDGLRGQSVDSLRANLDAILARVRHDEPRARVALVQMEAPRNFGAGYTAAFHAAFPAAARAAGVTLFPFLLDSVAGNPRLNQADGVHPTAEGARIVGDHVWRALRPLLAPSSVPAQASRTAGQQTAAQ